MMAPRMVRSSLLWAIRLVLAWQCAMVGRTVGLGPTDFDEDFAGLYVPITGSRKCFIPDSFAVHI